MAPRSQVTTRVSLDCQMMVAHLRVRNHGTQEGLERKCFYLVRANTEDLNAARLLIYDEDKWPSNQQLWFVFALHLAKMLVLCSCQETINHTRAVV